MQWIALNQIGRVALIPVFSLICLGAAGCSASFCAGSGCDNGKILFGSNFKQDSSGGSISVVGKTDTFTLGQSVAMVANLSENAGSTSLTLEVTGPNSHHSVPYGVSSPNNNELATRFTAANLNALGVSRAGSYTFRLTRGSKELAKGSMTEK